MKVFIITEGGKDMGFGHMTRCLSLYQAFEERGIRPKFIINGDNDIEYLLKDINYQIFNWLDKRNKLFEMVKDADIAIIDSYLADISFYNKILKMVKLPVYIDDNKRLEYPKGIVLNGSIYAEGLNYPKRNGVTYLLGTKYILLTKEYWDIPKKKTKDKIENVMIIFGGDDAKNMTPKIMNLLNKKYQGLKKNIIIGKAFHNIKEIEKEIENNTNLIYCPDAGKIKEIMLESDIAISAGGQTLHELARIGVPTIGICVAKNQLRNVEGWRKAGFLEYAGWYDTCDLEKGVEDKIQNLWDSLIRQKRKNIVKKILNGKGSLNVIKYIVEVFNAKNLYRRS